MSAEEQVPEKEPKLNMSFMRSCQFCGKDKMVLKQLIVGPCVSICNECVETCVEIIIEARDKGPLADLRMS
jgi:hypothetical protein